MKPIYLKTIRKFLEFPICLGIFLFLPAGTLDYWQGWVFAGIFLVCSIGSSLWLAKNDPGLLERRMNVGVSAEKEPAQKLIMFFMMLAFMGVMLVPGLDRRFGWSEVPVSIVLLGDLLIVVGFVAVFLVMKKNTYAASNISVADNQQVITTGPYAYVRHPMYAGALWILAGMPLALGSWWGLLGVIPALAAMVGRMLNEEKFLTKNLPGYAEYTQKVRYRLIPRVW